MIALDEVPVPDDCHDRAFLDVWIQDFGACALSAADELGIFDALADRGLTASAMAQRLDLDPGAVEAVCRSLVGLGTLLQRGDAFELHHHARLFWVKQSAAYRGREFHRHRDWEQHLRIVETLRSGGSPLLDTEESFSEAWRRGHVSDTSADNFTHVMHSMILSPSLAAARSGAFRGVQHLVDVGGGSGALAACVLAHHPDCSATVMDLAPVCAISERILATTRSGARVGYFPANFFADVWPTNADAFCLSNILHDWPRPTCRVLLGQAFSALPPGGRVFVHEALLDEGRCSPLTTALFNLLMHMNHQGQQFTRSELFTLLEACGFGDVRIVHTYSYWSLIEAIKRPPESRTA